MVYGREARRIRKMRLKEAGDEVMGASHIPCQAYTANGERVKMMEGVYRADWRVQSLPPVTAKYRTIGLAPRDPVYTSLRERVTVALKIARPICA